MNKFIVKHKKYGKKKFKAKSKKDAMEKFVIYLMKIKPSISILKKKDFKIKEKLL